MSPGPTFDRVYRELKARLKAAEFAPGEPLEPAALAPDLNASVTPVRDALHRLVGERLAEAPPHNGFCAPAPTEADLRDQWRWSATLVEIALRGSRETAMRGGAPEFGASDDTLAVPALLEAIVRRSGSDEHARAITNLNDRLAAVRTIEPAIFADTTEEWSELLLMHASGQQAVLRKALAAYHRRRIRAAPDLLAALRRETDRSRRP